MRLVCPNCGAQYEVADDVIPATGRDVQCSNCGNTWYARPEAEPEQSSIVMPTPAHQEPEPAVEEPVATAEETVEKEIAATDAPSTPPQPERAEIDPTVSEILQEEAAREEAQRMAESGENLESQTEMGLDAAEDLTDTIEADAREKETQDRIARMKGEEATAAAVAAAAAASRKEMLPDIEEINSTLRSSEERGEVVEPEPEVVQAKKKRGFRTGFFTMLLLILIAVLVYMFAPQIINMVPQLEGPLTSYVDLVNTGRLWLDGQIETLRSAMENAVAQNGSADTAPTQPEVPEVTDGTTTN